MEHKNCNNVFPFGIRRKVYQYVLLFPFVEEWIHTGPHGWRNNAGALVKPNVAPQPTFMMVTQFMIELSNIR